MVMNKKIVATDRMKLLDEMDGERYYVFTPSLRRVYPKSGNMRTINIKEYMLFLTRYIHGYKVYVLADTEDTVKGSIVFSNGGSFRYPFATKEDLIDGPSYTVPEFRGQGVAVRLGRAVMEKFERDYRVCYGTIANDNAASLARVRKNGSSALLVGSGDWPLLKYQNL